MSLYKIIENCGIVPVVVLEDAKDAIPLAKALLAGGINICEVTFRTAAAEEAIRQIAENVPYMIVGAGTVITKEQVKTAADAGAKFIVSPGTDLEAVRYAKEIGVYMLPGAVTPTEVSLSNLSSYLEFDKIAAVGGSWLCTKALIKEGKWDEITKLSKEAMDIFKKVRKL